MKLFTLDAEYKLQFEPQTLLLKPFAALYKRDKTKDKIKATSELAFVWFYTDIKSDFRIHTDLAEKEKFVKAEVNLPKGWKIDKVVQEAIDFYKEMSSSITSKILDDSMYVATKLSTEMRAAVNASGDLDIGEISKLLDNVKKMPEVIKALQAAEKAVLQEIKEQQGKTGAKEHALFEDGI